MDEAKIEDLGEENSKVYFKIPRWRMILEAFTLSLLLTFFVGPYVVGVFGFPHFLYAEDYVNHPTRFYAFEGFSDSTDTQGPAGIGFFDRTVMHIKSQLMIFYLLTGVFLMPWSVAMFSVFLRLKTQPWYRLLLCAVCSITGMFIGAVLTALIPHQLMLIGDSWLSIILYAVINYTLIIMGATLGAVLPFWNNFQPKTT